MFPTKFQLIWPNDFREDFLIGQSQTRTAYGTHGHFVQAKQFQRGRFFRNQPTRNKYYLWGSCVLTDWNEMSKLYRGLSIDFSYQVSVNLAKQIQRYSLKCEKMTDDGCQVMTKTHVPLFHIFKVFRN